MNDKKVKNNIISSRRLDDIKKDSENKKEEDLRIEKLRVDAATIITYITSTFVLGEEEKVFKIRKYLRDKNTLNTLGTLDTESEKRKIEIDELILRLTHFIKNNHKSKRT